MAESTWTLSELAERVAEVLRGYAAAANGQIRAVPDERAIRYYTTLGLIDRPVAMRGRTALYGARHLAQVVAIKRLQGAGQSLGELQALLPTLDDAALAGASGIQVPRRPRPAAARGGFWQEAPVEVEATPAPAPAPAMRAAAAAAAFAPMLALELAPGVTLSIAATRAATDADADAVIAAATALLAELRRRHLIGPTPAAASTPPAHPRDSNPEDL